MNRVNGQGREYENRHKEKNIELRIMDKRDDQEPKKATKQNKQGKNYRKIYMGTWNVRGTFETGELKRLIREIRRYKLDIVAVQETKQLGTEIMELEGTTFYKSGGDNRRRGVGFMIQGRERRNVLAFNPISDRLCTLRIKRQQRNISIINAHAPIEDAEEEEKNQFYERLEYEYERIPKRDIKMILGDMNAKVGKEDVYVTATGKHSKHERANSNGERLISFAMERQMVIRSTQLRRREIHKGTWVSPDNKTINQIDHVIIEKKNMEFITKIKSMRGAECNSDHFLVKVTCKNEWNIKKKKEIATDQKRKFNSALLQREEIQEIYKQKLREEGATVVPTEGVEELWEAIKTVIRRTNEEMLTGGPKEQKRKNWYDDECEEITEALRKARQILLAANNEVNLERYRKIRREMKKT